MQKQLLNFNDGSVKTDMFMGGNTPHLPWAVRLADGRKRMRVEGPYPFCQKLASNLTTTSFIVNIRVRRRPRRKMTSLKPGLWDECTTKKFGNKSLSM
jgi:hypothetical protein